MPKPLSTPRKSALLRHLLIAGISFPALLAAGTQSASAQTVINDGETLELQNGNSVNGAVTISGSGTAGSGAIHSISGNTAIYGDVILAADATIRSDAGSDLTLDHALNGNGFALTTTGAGRISILSSVNDLSSLTVNGGNVYMIGVNNFSGPVTVNAGQLDIFGNNQSIGDFAAVTINTGAIMTVAVSETIGSLSGGGRILASAGTPTLTVGGNNASTTFSGTLENGGNFGIYESSLAKIGTGTLTLTGANSYTGTTTISDGTLEVGNGGTTGALGTGNVLNNAALRFNRSNVLTVANGIGGTGSLTQAGNGKTILAGANTYGGTTTIAAGTLNVRNAGALGSAAAGTVVQNGGTLEIEGGITINGEALTLNGTGTAGSGALRNVSGNNSFTGPITLGSNASIVSAAGQLDLVSLDGGGNALTVSGPGAVVFTGTLSNLSSLTKTGSNILALFGTGTYTGPTTIDAGAIQVSSGAALSDTGAVIINSAGQLYVTASETIGSLAGSGEVLFDNSAQTLTMGGNNSSTVFSGLIRNGSGTGTIIKTGTGTLTLTGANSYTGTTTISGGTLQVGNGGTTGTLGSGAVTIASGAALLFNRSNAATVANLIQGNGNVTIGGTGAVTFNVANTYAGTTQILSGATLTAANSGALGTGAGGTTVDSGGMLQFQGGIVLADNLMISGSGTSGSGALRNLSDQNIVNGTVTLAGDALIRSDGNPNGSPPSQLSLGTLNGGGFALTTTGTGRVSIAGNITNLSSLTQNDGVLMLGGTNTFTGPVTLNGGYLQLYNGQALADTVALTVNTGAVVQLAASETIGSLAGGGRVVSSNGSTTLTVGGNNSSTTFSGSLENGGSNVANLAKIGTGTLMLTGANSYTGTTTISGGTLQVGNGGITGTLGTGNVVNNAALVFNRSDALIVVNAIGGTGTLTKQGSGTLTLTGTNSYGGITTISAGTLQIGNGGTTGSLGSGNVVNNAVLAFNRSDAVTLANAISGTGSLVKQGGGTLTLTGANNYTGATTIAGGTLNIRSAGALGTSATGTTVQSGGTLELQGGITLPTEALILYGTGTANSGALHNVSGRNVWNGSVSLGSDTRIVVDGNAAPGGDELVMQGIFSGNGNALTVGGTGRLTMGGSVVGLTGLTMAGTGVLSLADAGYAGATIIDAGTLSLQANSLGASAFTVNEGGILSLAANNRMGSLSGTGVVIGNGNSLELSEGGSFGGTLSGVNELKLHGGTFALTGNTGLGAGLVNVLAGATFDISGIGGTSFSVGRIAADGKIALGAKTLVVASGNAEALNGDISGTGGLTLAAGLLGLSGIKSYTGVTRVETNGTLGLFGTMLASRLSVDGLVMVEADSTVAGLSGTGQVRFSTSTLTVTGDSDFSGTLFTAGPAIYSELAVTGGNFILRGQAGIHFIRVNGGSFTYADGATLGRNYGALAVVPTFNLDAGDLIVDRSDAVTLSEIYGSGNLVKNGTGTLTLLTNLNVPGSGYKGTTSVNAGTLIVNGGAALSDTAALTIAGGAHVQLGANETVGGLAGAGTLDNGGNTLTIANAGSNDFSGVISGNGGLALTGGTQILSGDNSYTGGTSVTNATLQLGNAGTTGAVAGNIVLSSGTLVVNRSDDLTLGGFSGTGTFVQGGTGTTQLAGLSDLIGITVTRGGLKLVGNATTLAAVTVNGGTLDLGGVAGGTASFGRLVGTGGGAIQLGATTLTVGDSASTVFDGVISGTGGLIKTGGGVLTLSGANAYTGLTEVREGTLQLGASEVLADDSTLSVLDGATLDLQGFNETVAGFSIQGNLIGTGTLTAGYYRLYGGTIAQTLGAGTVYQISGTTLLQGDSGAASVHVQGGTLALGAAERLSDSAVVDVLAGATLDLGGFDETIGSLVLNDTLDGNGTLTAASYTLNRATVNATLGTGALSQAGGTSLLKGSAAAQTVAVNGGTLSLGASDRLADTATVTVASGATLDLQGFDETVGALALSGTLDGVGTLTAASYTLNGATVNAGLGGGTLTQAGGASVLNGNFAGSATVAGGSLAVVGQIRGDVTVNQGTLTGIGDIAGAVMIADGGHLAGKQGDTLDMGSLVLSAGSIVDVSLSQPSSDGLFYVGGNLTLDGRLNITAAPNFGAGVYRLFDYEGTLTDNGLAIGTVTGSTAAGLSVQTAATGQVNLVNVNGATLAFWDGGNAELHDNGLVNGGSGNWSVGGRNWTTQSGAVNGGMTPAASFAVFQGRGGTVTIDNATGQVSATGVQFAANGYTVSGGALALSGERATIRVGDGTAAGGAFTATIASALTGGSTLVKTDLGALVLTGANTYTGGTVIEAGTLIGNSGSIRGNVANSGALVFYQVADGTYAGSVTGAGTVTKSGAGALTLTGANATKWTVTDGSLISTASLFTGDVALSAGASLVFNQTGEGSYAGVLSGVGQLLVRGGGTVRLTGDSSAFTGTTGVNSLLSVNGKLGGLVDVLAGGRLQGTGTIGSAHIAGAIAPGNSIGTLNVTGNLSFLTGSTYEVEANPAGESDRIVASGNVTIAGDTTVAVLAASGRYGINTSYTILTAAGGLTGTFSNVTSNLAFLTPSLSYSATAVTLTLTRNTIDFAAVAQTRNQQAVAPAIEALGLGNAVYNAVAVLTDSEARAAFDQLAGADYASIRGQLIEDSRFLRDAVLSRSDLGGIEGLSVWGRALGSWNSMDGNAEAQGHDRSIKGFVTGFDGSFGPNWRAGVVLGYGDSEFRTGNATHNADSYSAGGYMLGAYGALRVQLGAAYSWNDVRSQRSVVFGDFAQLLSDKYDAGTFQLFGEVGAKADFGRLEFQPFVGLAHVSLSGGKIAEHGGAAALSGGTDGFAVTYGNVGLRTKLGFDLGTTRARLAGSATLRQTLGDHVPVIDLRFAGGKPFKVEGVPLDRTTGLFDAGIEIDLGKSTTFGVSYTGAYGARTADHGARASVSVRF